MITRDQLTLFLESLYQYHTVDDYCENGLQIEGKEHIQKIACGVSFNMPFLQQAIAYHADALIVHHGIFGRDFFKIKGVFRQKIKLLMEHDISLYGIHLPLDLHPKLGHSAILLAALGIENMQPIEFGYMGHNHQNHSLETMLNIFHHLLHHDGEVFPTIQPNSPFSLSQRLGFTILANGPAIPRQVAIISGGGAKYYETSIEKGIDTFFTGEIKEHIPAISLETGTNFIHLGHYNSEKPGILAMQKQITENFNIQCDFLAVPNEI